MEKTRRQGTTLKALVSHHTRSLSSLRTILIGSLVFLRSIKPLAECERASKRSPDTQGSFNKRGGRESNPQPPDRQSGALTN